jgi:hypothetical protein
VEGAAVMRLPGRTGREDPPLHGNEAQSVREAQYVDKQHGDHEQERIEVNK